MFSKIHRVLYKKAIQLFGGSKKMFAPSHLHAYNISPKGFSIEPVFNSKLIYREADRKMNIFIELLTGDYTLALYRESMKNWEAPYDTEPITKEEQERIIGNIREIFRFQGYEIDVES